MEAATGGRPDPNEPDPNEPDPNEPDPNEPDPNEPDPNEPDLTAPAYVVLGMVRLGAKSGYEIKRMVEMSIRYFWTISQVQIYPSLQRLEQAGLLTGRAEPQGRRPRRVYQITPAGEAALRDWLLQPEPLPFEIRDIGLVKLFFADTLRRDDALRLLGAISERSEQRLAGLRAVEPVASAAERDGNLYPMLTLKMGIGYHQAMIDVCREFAGRFEPVRD